MSIDPITPATLAAKLLTVGQVCARYPGKGGGRLAPSTVTRWILTGCPDRGGNRVKLRAIRCGTRWLLDPDDLTTFFAALAATPPTPPPSASPTRIDAARSVAAARACAALARRGA